MDNETRIQLYNKLYLARRCEDAIVQFYPDDEMRSPMHMSYGQEATAAGVCHALKQMDPIFTSYRTHATYLCKTMECEKFFAELYGKTSGTARGKSGSMHLANPALGHYGASAIVGSQLAPAVGTAYAIKYKKEKLVSCVFFGDGAIDEGTFWESINLAALKEVPIVFVCEDNGFAVHTPSTQRQGFSNIINVLKEFRIRLFEETTGDVESIYETAVEAIGYCRSFQKPVFIKLNCYRYLEHVGINEDFHDDYRDKEEFKKWKERDSLKIQRTRLIDEGIDEENIIKIERQIDLQIENAIKKAKLGIGPKPEELLQGVLI